jgi:phage gp37-like protein
VPKTLDAARAWVTWLGGEPGAVRQERASRYAMWGEIDFRSSVFAPFADPRFGDFTKIHVWAYRAIDPAASAGSARAGPV